MLNTYSSDSYNDIEKATKLERPMVTRCGMCDEFDMIALETVNNKYLGSDPSLTCLQQTA